MFYTICTINLYLPLACYKEKQILMVIQMVSTLTLHRPFSLHQGDINKLLITKSIIFSSWVEESPPVMNTDSLRQRKIQINQADERPQLHRWVGCIFIRLCYLHKNVFFYSGIEKRAVSIFCFVNL